MYFTEFSLVVSLQLCTSESGVEWWNLEVWAHACPQRNGPCEVPHSGPLAMIVQSFSSASDDVTSAMMLGSK